VGLNKWTFTEDIVSDELISEVEKKYGIVFPKDYKECVKQYNGGYPEPNVFDYDDGIQGVFNDLISFTNTEMNMFMFYDFLNEELPQGIVPFGRDPFGNLLCFDYRYNTTNPSIVFFDHEDDEENDVIFYVTDSYTDLLERLYSLEDR